eukprot:Phypoly_transcript_01450.p1 GENE.Phypoly_transcript_01450~~Phypoly_transcript_01450.p1  ORF type:complete len:1050 (+),score=198.62 Phypoly_transcript_01450:36-3152(+)
MTAKVPGNMQVHEGTPKVPFSLEPLIANRSLSITCLDSYRNKLLVGTESQGVIVFDITENADGQFSAQVEQVRREITEGLRVDQISAVEQWDSVLVLSMGEVIACNFKINKGESLFSNQHTLLHTDIYKFVLFVQRFTSPVLCLAGKGNFYFYKSTGKNLMMFAKFDFAHLVLDMALTSHSLYVVYIEKGSKTYKSGKFALINRTFVPDVYPPQESPPLVRSCGFEQVLFHSQWTSTVFNDGVPLYKLTWNIPAHDIKIWDQFCIAIQAESAEIVLLEAENGKPTSSLGVVSIETLSADSLQFLTSTGHPYAATHNAVWRLKPSTSLSPSPSPSLSPSTSQPNSEVPNGESAEPERCKSRWTEVFESIFPPRPMPPHLENRMKELNEQSEKRKIRLANLYEARKNDLERAEQEIKDVQSAWEEKKKQIEERQQKQLEELRVLEWQIAQQKLDENEAMWERTIQETEAEWREAKKEIGESQKRNEEGTESKQEGEEKAAKKRKGKYEQMYDKYYYGTKGEDEGEGEEGESLEKVMDQVAENDAKFLSTNEISPNDSILVLGMDENDLRYFDQHNIRTVEDLAKIEPNKFRMLYNFKYWDKYKKAVVVRDVGLARDKLSNWGEPLWEKKEKEPNDFFECHPTDSLLVLGMSIDDAEYFSGFGINTISDLARQPGTQIVNFYGKKHWEHYFRAKTVVIKWAAKRKCNSSSPFSDVNLTSAPRISYADPPIPQSNWDDYPVENKPKPKKEREIFGDLNPEDPLDALGIPEHQIEFMRSIDIFTIRQFAQMHETEVGAFDDELLARHLIAVECTKAHPEKALKVIEKAPEGPNYGYIYLPATEFDAVVTDKVIKSSYVLFQEYVECAPEKRHDHAWKAVYLQYLPKATKHFQAEPDGAELILSDADVFSYLCWAHATSFGKLDITAGARAIYFHWGRVNPQHVNYLGSLALSSDNPVRNKMVQINLSLLCHNYGGKLFSRMEETGDGDWEAVTLEDCDQAKEYHDKKGSDSVYFSIYTGCIVLPSGTIPADCFGTDPTKIRSS